MDAATPLAIDVAGIIADNVGDLLYRNYEDQGTPQAIDWTDLGDGTATIEFAGGQVLRITVTEQGRS